jgi:predicted deacylase
MSKAMMSRPYRIALYLILLLVAVLLATTAVLLASEPATLLQPATNTSVTLARPSPLATAVPSLADTPTLGPPAGATATAVLPTAPTAATTSPAAATLTGQPWSAPAISVTETIGYSAEGRPIIAYRFKSGPTHLVFVGGIHGGYEWNSILLAYEMIAAFQRHPWRIPDSLTITIIPSANPDGQFLVTGREGLFSSAEVAADSLAGRFNGNQVDLNRNWDCEWTPQAFWRNQPISAGTGPFSEPETAALRNFLLAQRPAAVVFWHSQFRAVFAAGCPETYPPALELAHRYGQAAGYPVYERFTSYPITGDASDWLATQEIPSISVELTTHNELDWPENWAAILALLSHYGATPAGQEQ